MCRFTKAAICNTGHKPCGFGNKPARDHPGYIPRSHPVLSRTALVPVSILSRTMWFPNNEWVSKKTFVPVWRTAACPLCGSCWEEGAVLALSASLPTPFQSSASQAASAPDRTRQKEREWQRYVTKHNTQAHYNKPKITNPSYLSPLIVHKFALSNKRKGIKWEKNTMQTYQWSFLL